MWKKAILVTTLGFFVFSSFSTWSQHRKWSQPRKLVSIPNRKEIKYVVFDFTAKTGNYYIRNDCRDDILSLYGTMPLTVSNHTFSQRIIDKTLYTSLVLGQEINRGFGKHLSVRVFGGQNESLDDLSRIYLNQEKTYSLKLNCDLGNISIDLSRLPLKHLSINGGSVDVSIFYKEQIENSVTMDTLLLKVDVGSIRAKHLNLVQSKVIVAEIGFGDVYMDFSTERPLQNHQVIGKVGAGNLIVALPHPSTPVKVNVGQSLFCGLDFHPNLKQINNNTFANNAYISGENRNGIVFDFDVSVGLIVFRNN